MRYTPPAEGIGITEPVPSFWMRASGLRTR